MIRIKVCGLTDPLNAREVAGAGADYIGFIFYRESKRYVGDNPNPDLFRNLPGQARKVGVFVNENPDTVIELANRFGLDAVQLHGDETAGFCQTVRMTGLTVIKAFGMDSEYDSVRLSPYMNACDFFMFDTQTKHHGGSGLKFRWEILRKYEMDKPFFLSGGIDPADSKVIREFSHKAFYAADINSRFESAPGMKNAILVNTFIQEIKTNLS